MGSLRKVKTRYPHLPYEESLNTCVWPVLTYGADTLTLTRRTAIKIRVAQRVKERAMLGLSLRDRVPAQI